MGDWVVFGIALAKSLDGPTSKAWDWLMKRGCFSGVFSSAICRWAARR